MKKYTFIPLLFSIILNSCAYKQVVYTNSYQDVGRIMPNGSFEVISNEDAVNPILDKEIKRQIEAKLTEKGYELKGDPSYSINYGYEISSKLTINDRALLSGASLGTWYGGGNSSYHYDFLTRTNEVGEIYLGKLLLRVLDSNKKVIWFSETFTESEERDLRKLTPYLVTGAMEYFGYDTKTNKQIKFSPKDPRLQNLTQKEQTN